MIYEYLCKCGKVTEKVMKLSEYGTPQYCECGETSPMQKVILTAPSGFVQADIHYQSPITGEAITSRAKRIEDLAKHNCIEYDPCMKQDYQRRVQEREQALEKSVDQTVDAVWEKMPARKKEQLVSELSSGVDVTPVRQTVEA